MGVYLVLAITFLFCARSHWPAATGTVLCPLRAGDNVQVPSALLSLCEYRTITYVDVIKLYVYIAPRVFDHVDHF
jgi:hypothetical protein